MARVVDITDKLTFDENPSLKTKGTLLEVNADAPTMLKVMGVLNHEDPGPNEIMEAYNLILPEKSRKEIEKLKLSFQDLLIVVQAAVSLVTGEDKSQGER